MTALNAFSDLDELYVGLKRYLFLYFNFLRKLQEQVSH